MRIPTTLAFPLLLICCSEPIAPAQREWLPDQDSPSGKLVSGNEGKSAPATVVFYNVENLFDTHDDPGFGDDDFTPGGKLNWTDDRYEHKLHQLAEAISMAGEELPVMIGLCEVENRKVVDDLAKAPPLDRGNYTVVHQDSPDERGIDVALLVDRKRATVGETVWLTVDLGTDKTRQILQASVHLKGTGPLEVFVNHWPSRREGKEKSAPKRIEAARTLKKAISAIYDKAPGTGFIVMGDLNDEPSDESVSQWLGACDFTRDMHCHLYDLVLQDTAQPLGSINYNGEWQYFDHIIVSRSIVSLLPSSWNGWAHSIKDPRLIFHHPKYGDQPNRTFSGTKYHKDGYSDHLPVVLRLE